MLPYHSPSVTNLRPVDPSGFHWIPAGVRYSEVFGLGVYIRHKPYEDTPIKLIHRSVNQLLVSCPDRDLLFVRDAHNQWGYIPPPGVYDSYVTLTPTWANASRDLDLPFIMLNSIDHIGDKRGGHSPNLRVNRPRLAHEPYLMADSGGFQLMSGGVDWIDPYQLASWFSDNVDLAMVLDTPGDYRHQDDLKVIAQAQRKNTDILLANKRHDLELINIIRGETHEDRLFFHKVVEHTEITRAAIPSLYQGELTQSLDDLFLTLDALGDTYPHFHLLGLFNLRQLLPIIRFSVRSKHHLITADSSGYLQGAKAKEYAFHPSIDSPWVMKPVGTAAKNFWPNHRNYLPCGCPVCQAIRYFDVLSVLPGSIIKDAFAFHTAYQMNNYVKTMVQLAGELDVTQLSELVEAQLGGRANKAEVKTALRFADAVAEEGCLAARKKFSLYLALDESVYQPTQDDLHSEPQPDTDTEEPPGRAYQLSLRYLNGNLSETQPDVPNVVTPKQICARVSSTKYRKGV